MMGIKTDKRKEVLSEFLEIAYEKISHEETIEPERGYYDIDVYSTPLGNFSVEGVDDWIEDMGREVIYSNLKNINTHLIAQVLDIPETAVIAMKTISDADYLYAIQKLVDVAIGEDDFFYETYARGELDSAINAYGSQYRGCIIRKL